MSAGRHHTRKQIGARHSTTDADETGDSAPAPALGDEDPAGCGCTSDAPAERHVVGLLGMLSVLLARRREH